MKSGNIGGGYLLFLRMHTTIPQLTLEELRQWKAEGRDFLLIDVREPDEHEAFNIGGQLIPLGKIMRHVNDLPEDRPIVVYCKRGIRSQIAIQRWAQRKKATFYNLQGGIFSEILKEKR
jgi:rhodanese-related sulfurtransferase